MYENCKNRKIEGGQEVEVELQIPIILGENGEDAAEEERVKITIFFVENLLLFPGNSLNEKNHNSISKKKVQLISSSTTVPF